MHEALAREAQRALRQHGRSPEVLIEGCVSTKHTFPLPDELASNCSQMETMIVPRVAHTGVDSLFRKHYKRVDREASRSKSHWTAPTESPGEQAWLQIGELVPLDEYTIRRLGMPLTCYDGTTLSDDTFRLEKVDQSELGGRILDEMLPHVPLDVLDVIVHWMRNIDLTHGRGSSDLQLFRVYVRESAVMKLVKANGDYGDPNSSLASVARVLSRLWRGDDSESLLTALEQFGTALPTPRWSCVSSAISAAKKQRLPDMAKVDGLEDDERDVCRLFDRRIAQLSGMEAPDAPEHETDASIPLRGQYELFDYQMLSVAWMFDLERRIAHDDASTGLKADGASFDLECVDQLWRGHGFVQRLWAAKRTRSQSNKYVRGAVEEAQANLNAERDSLVALEKRVQDLQHVLKEQNQEQNQGGWLNSIVDRLRSRPAVRFDDGNDSDSEDSDWIDPRTPAERINAEIRRLTLRIEQRRQYEKEVVNKVQECAKENAAFQWLDRPTTLLPMPLMLDAHRMCFRARPRQYEPRSAADTAAFAPRSETEDVRCTTLPTTAVSIAHKHNPWLEARTLGTRGGILADQVGLGKTLTVLALCALHRRALPSERVLHVHNGLVQSRATLVLVPEHLFHQWLDEALKFFDLRAGTDLIGVTFDDVAGTHKAVRSHRELTALELQNAHLVVSTFQYLGSPEYVRNAGINTEHINRRMGRRGQFAFERAYEYNEHAGMWSQPSEPGAGVSFQHFHWQRIVIDESHEIFRPSTDGHLDTPDVAARGRVFCFQSRFRFALTATPFSDVHHRQTYNYVRFLRMSLGGTPLQQCRFSPLRGGRAYSLIDLCSFGDGVIAVQAYRDWLALIFERFLLRRNTTYSIGVENYQPSYEEEYVDAALSPTEQDLFAALSRVHPSLASAFLSDPSFVQRLDQEAFFASTTPMQQRVSAFVARDAGYRVTPEWQAVARATQRLLQGQVALLGRERQILQSLLARQPNDLQTQRSLDDNAARSAELQRHCRIVEQLGGRIAAETAYGHEKSLLSLALHDSTYTALSSARGTKVAATCRKIAQVLAKDESSKVVVFSSFKGTLSVVDSVLREFSVRGVLHCTNRRDMSQALSSFRNVTSSNKTRVLLMLLTDESAGANLLLATHIVLVDTSVGRGELVEATEMQAIGRALRQKKKVPPMLVRIVTAADTVWRRRMEEHRKGQGRS